MTPVSSGGICSHSMEKHYTSSTAVRMMLLDMAMVIDKYCTQLHTGVIWANGSVPTQMTVWFGQWLWASLTAAIVDSHGHTGSE